MADAPLALLEHSEWQMSFGERAAMEGVLTQLRPQLSVEIGTADGGSLATIVRHSDEVHSFDLREPGPLADRFPDVHFHSGDSHALLPQVLATFAEAGRNVDFVLVDGDHSSDGVRRDAIDLLSSPAVSETIILLHDTANELVRHGLDRVPFEAHPKVAFVELDFVGGYVMSRSDLDGEIWGGLGLVWVSSRQPRYFSAVHESPYYPAVQMLRAARDALFEPADGATPG